MAIQQTKNKVARERARLKAYQTGAIKIVSTGRPHLDDTLSGLLPGDIVVVGGHLVLVKHSSYRPYVKMLWT